MLLGRLIPLLTRTGLIALSGFLTLPALISVLGAGPWSVVAVGQAIGAIASVILLYGWSVTGPAQVAAGGVVGARVAVVESRRVRGVLAAPVLGLVGIFAWLTMSEHWALFYVGFLSMALVGFGNVWYYVGGGGLWRLLVLDGLPRASANLGAVAVLLTGQPGLAGLALIASGAGIASLATQVDSAISSGKSLSLAQVAQASREIRGFPAIVRSEAGAAGASLVGSLYGTMPLVIYTVLGFPSLPLFAFMDKVAKQSLTGLAPLVTAMQGWVPSSSLAETQRRANQSRWLTMVAGILIGILVGSISGPIFRWLGAGEIPYDLATGAALAGLIAASFVELSLGRSYVVPLGNVHLLSRVTSWGSILGIGLMLAGASTLGAAAAIGGLAIGQMLKAMAYLVWGNRRR